MFSPIISSAPRFWMLAAPLAKVDPLKFRPDHVLLCADVATMLTFLGVSQVGNN